MAFVFQSSRWEENKQRKEIGPGSYQIKCQQKSKLGLILPVNINKFIATLVNQKPTCQEIQRNIHNQISYQQKILRKNQTCKKLSKRMKSGKLCSYNSFQKQNTEIQKDKIRKVKQIKQNSMCFQVHFNQDQRKPEQFANTLIRDSFKNVKTSSSIQQLFNDKSLRMFKPITYQLNKQKLKHQKQNFKIKGFMSKKQASPNKNLVNFVRQSQKSQNCFISKPINLNFIDQKQNFVIASDNCHVQRFEHKDKIIFNNYLKGNKIFSQYESCGDVHTTGLEDDLSQSQFQYLTDETPGPGYYEIIKSSFIKKSQIQKFGITEERFKEKINNDKVLDLNIDLPRHKIKSKACQSKVAFGKSIAQSVKIYTKQQNFKFDQESQFSEQKVTCNLKRQQSAGAVFSKSNRFVAQKRLFYQGPDFFEKDKQNPLTLPNSIFMSKVQRNYRPYSSTAKVDFQGQNIYTIERKIQKARENLDYLEDEYPGFSTRAPRFIYKQQQNNENTKCCVQKQEKFQKRPKGYTFTKDQKELNICENLLRNPSPGSYETEMRWVKPSHHIKYKI